MSSEKLSKYNVLFVDDEMQVLKAIKRGLHLEEYNKFFATTGEEALEIIKNEEIAMIITDMKMPKMDGLSLLKKVNEIKPNIVKVILSGYTNLAQIIATINAINIYKFILKPWDLKTELKPIIVEGLKKYEENIAYIENIESANKKNELFKKLVTTNQQNYKQIQEDFSNIKQLHKIIVNYSYFLSLQLKEDKLSKLRLKDELSFIENIVSDYIETLPRLKTMTTVKDFKFKVESIIHNLIGIDHTEKINFKTNLKDNNDLPVNFVHLSWFMRILFKDILKITEKSIIELNITGDEKGDELTAISFKININHPPRDYDSIRKNTIYILSSAFVNILNGSFRIEANDESVVTLTAKN